MAFEKKVINGKEHLIAVIEFDLGEIKEHKENFVNGHRAVSVPMGIKTSMMIMKETIKNMVKQEDYEKYEEYLEEYCRLFLNDMIGVESYPIQYNAEGKLVGLKKDAELI
jgi:uncharacterized protein YqkB